MKDVKCRSVLNDVLVPRNRNCLNVAKIQNESCCTIEYDRILRAPVLVMRGSVTQTRVQIPRESRVPASLQLPHSLVVLQVFLGSTDYFALEIVLSLNMLIRVKLIIGTPFCKCGIDECSNGVFSARVPLIIPRNRWVQVVIHVSGIVTQLFNLPSLRCIVSISLSGTCKASRLMTGNNEVEAMNSTPADMTLFAVPAYALPIWKSAPVACLPANDRKISFVGGDNSSELSFGSRLPIVPEITTDEKKYVDLTLVQARSPKLDLPSIGSSCSSVKFNQPSRFGENGPPSHDRPISPAESNFCGNSASVATHKVCNEKMSINASSVAGAHVSYMRLVDRLGPSRPSLSMKNSGAAQRTRPSHAPTKEALNLSTNIAAATAVSPTDAWYGITRWEEAVDILSNCGTTNVKVGLSHSPFAVKATSGGKNGSTVSTKPILRTGNYAFPQSRLKRLAESRRPHIFYPSSKRPQKAGTTHDTVDVDDTLEGGKSGRGKKRHLIRRRNIRRRIKRLKEAQVSTRRMHELKKLSASELPIDLEEEALMMIEDTVEVMAEPRCGYGFGYLGVLRECGEFEADEAADTKLKGALTLELSDEEEDEEDDDNDEDEDEYIDEE